MTKKLVENLEKLKALLRLNYCLIFDKCYCCGQKKNKRVLFCSLRCIMKTTREGLTS
jgi:hypothetical protein